ncbi:Glycoside hydrolase family 24 protein [Mycena sanguinolenta]|uniref:Glycoside hydrolase family 24 protein n=1 Tax=Mycena sanguinolenta TaxID=230812 RepID=A0A8H7CGM3_9AGAR|nr:Glycoside hydrolase family 24 protein [Mycena sanguinolenta]
MHPTPEPSLPMRFSPIIVLLASVTTTWATVNGSCISSPGICISTSSCSAGGGVSAIGLCPDDPENIRCCTKKPCAPGGGGQCQFTSTCTGTILTGRQI